MSSQTNVEGGTPLADKSTQGEASDRSDGNRRENPKGDPCEFITPPNNLLAKVTGDPTMAEGQKVKKGKFKLDKSLLAKMDSIIDENLSASASILDEKIKEFEPLYEHIRKDDGTPPEDLTDKLQHIYGVAKGLDNIPVARITASLLKYMKGLPPTEAPASSIIIAHFDALFSRKTLNSKLDPPTKLVLTALETLTDHALLQSK